MRNHYRYEKKNSFEKNAFEVSLPAEPVWMPGQQSIYISQTNLDFVEYLSFEIMKKNRFCFISSREYPGLIHLVIKKNRIGASFTMVPSINVCYNTLEIL